MAERGVIPVVFDPFIIERALFPPTAEPSDEHDALVALNDNCIHRLIFDDNTGKLQGEYANYFSAQFPIIQRNLAAMLRLGKVTRRKRTAAQRESIPGLRGQHSSFLLAAIAVEPTYVVTRVRQHLDSRVLVQYLQTNHNLMLLSARDFVSQLYAGL